MRRPSIASLAIVLLLCAPAIAQITTLASGDNQKASVTQYTAWSR